MHVPRADRARWAYAINDATRERLKTAAAAWYGASALSRNSFRKQFFDPFTSDEIAGQLRSAARGMMEGRTYDELADAGGDLARAAKDIGVDRWPHFLGDAGRRAIAAVADGKVPGVVKVGGADTDAALALLGALIAGAAIYHATRPSGRASDTNRPAVAEQPPPERGNGEDPAIAPANLAKPGEAVLPDDRRKHILEGDADGRGGHRASRGAPEKSKFPADWSDDTIIEAVEDVANDPASQRVPAKGDRTSVQGTRNGIDIEVIVGRDGKTIVTAYPINNGQNRSK